MARLILCSVLLISQVILITAEDNFCEEELKCIEKLHLKKDYIRNILTDESSPFLPENDVDFNSFLFCHWNERGLQDINGNFHFDKIVECIQEFPRSEFNGRAGDQTPIGSKIAVAATELCKHTPKGDNHGQTAVKLQNCIDKNIMELVEKEA
ncbi:hypothetical protein FQA39_LY06897 [Lamprigera yunnana]|nr:hypothetical protein FQA39_LY06897 [Lamprigera yunnana]